ncbi:MAG TPA: tyrosine-type recombinase/integrase, partial [Desulfatiglandales bacterium]|nr:tyrosine-type recombinase/integrase [Desulfatiglandales bacterium]
DTANALLSEIRNQTRFDPTQYVKKKQSTYLFQNLIKAWLADAERKVEQNEFAPGTLVIKKTFAHKYFLPYFQGEDIRRLKTHDLTEFKQGLSVSGNYLNSIIAQLRSVFSYARNEELIRNVPRITTVKVQEPSKTVLLLEEQDALIEQLGCHKPIFRFLKLTGCRPSMARALYRSDLNWKQRIIVFQHNYSGRKLTRVLKAGQILEFPMTDELYDLLSSIPANLRHRHVFINPITGKPYSHHITPILYRACDKLGWPRIAVKNFCRHSFATNLLADGTPIQFVSQLLGHRSVKTTEKSYATARIEVLRKVLDKNYVKTMSKNENDQK